MRNVALAELEVFTPTEAVTFLLGRSGSDDQAAASQIAELLGLLPLALEQAGAYVRETRLSLVDYLARLQRSPALAVAKGRPRDRDPTDTVATTWQVSLERVQPTPGAVALLEVCAFLGSEELPRDLFAHQLDPPLAELGVLAEDPFVLDAAVAALRRFGLVKADEQLLTVHRLLQQIIRDRLEPADKAARVAVAVRLLDWALPVGSGANPGMWPACARLLPHALAATEHAEQLGVEPLATAHLLERAADYLHGRARYLDARRLHERALHIREKRQGPDHPDTAQSLNGLANVLYDQGDLDSARPLYERTLTIWEALGADRPTTAQSLNNLALVLYGQGDLDSARRLHERALHIREARLGSDHPATAESLNNLALVLYGQGDLDGARHLHERALAIHEARLGPHHPDTAYSLSGLAQVLHKQSDLENARRLHERALHIREARLGPDHPDTARSRRDLTALTAELDGGS